MKNCVCELYVAIKGLINQDGQDLVEYALVIALMAFGCAACMSSIANAINASFSRIVSVLSVT